MPTSPWLIHGYIARELHALHMGNHNPRRNDICLWAIYNLCSPDSPLARANLVAEVCWSVHSSRLSNGDIFLVPWKLYLLDQIPLIFMEPNAGFFTGILRGTWSAA